ncbi:putative reverse transcriptase domain-containing protein [Tanacetum coccineum]
MRLQPTRLKENSEQLCLYVQMPGVGKEEDVKVYVEHASIVIKGQIDQELIDNTSCKMYMCWLDLEFFDIYKFSDIKAEMRRNSGELKLTIPRTKEEEDSRRGPEYTWEREDQMQKKYPHLFANPVSASQATS